MIQLQLEFILTVYTLHNGARQPSRLVLDQDMLHHRMEEVTLFGAPVLRCAGELRVRERNTHRILRVTHVFFAHNMSRKACKTSAKLCKGLKSVPSGTGVLGRDS